MLNNLSIQWHITADCNNRCRHCYMFDKKTYEIEKAGELSDSELFKIIENIEAFEKKWNAEIKHFAITGGDPLLRKNWFEFVKTLRNKNKSVSMMGNADTLTEENLKKLSELGILRYQLSLDGLEEKHDYIRGKGNLQKTIKGIEKLSQFGIHSQIMFSMNAENKDDLIPLLNFIANNSSAKSFSFDVVSSVGNAKNHLSGELNSQVLYKIFREYLTEKKRLAAAGNPIRLNEKPNLFNVLRATDGDEYINSAKEISVISGCLIGWTCVCILSNGDVLACRRFPLKIGKMPEQSFEDIFLGSKELRKFRRPEYFEECGNCEYYKICRGCPAVVYGFTGNPFAKNPLCFKDLLKPKKTFLKQNAAAIPIDVSYEDEYNLIANKAPVKFSNDIAILLNKEDIQTAILKLENKTEKRLFINNPEEYCKNNDLHLTDYEKIFVTRWDKSLLKLNKQKILTYIFRKQLS